MKPLDIRAEAELDVVEAALWYENESPGLGAAFSMEVERTVERIAENPLQFAQREAGMRLAMLDRFPYGIYFLDEVDRVTLFAILHLRRDPDVWRRRR